MDSILSRIFIHTLHDSLHLLDLDYQNGRSGFGVPRHPGIESVSIPPPSIELHCYSPSRYQMVILQDLARFWKEILQDFVSS